MSDETLDWRLLISAAKDHLSVAWLYLHTETYLRTHGSMPDIASKLRQVFAACQASEQADNDTRARKICAAIKLNTKTLRLSAQPSAEILISAGVAPELAHFVSERLAQAQSAALSASNRKVRARAVTTALLLNRPVGAPPANFRRGSYAPLHQIIDINTTHGIRETFEVEIEQERVFSPCTIINSVESILERTPPNQRDIKAACAEVAKKLHKDPKGIETEYHSHPELHSRWLSSKSAKKKRAVIKLAESAKPDA